jgi:ubiquitin C-terminal hydrolase
VYAGFRSTGRHDVAKLDAHVPFPATLDLASFVTSSSDPATHMDELRTSSATPPSTRLRLYALIEHEGSFEGGHYVAYVRLGASSSPPRDGKEGGSWYRMSDSAISCVDEQAVLGKQPFLLFYERMA